MSTALNKIKEPSLSHLTPIKFNIFKEYKQINYKKKKRPYLNNKGYTKIPCSPGQSHRHPGNPTYAPPGAGGGGAGVLLAGVEFAGVWLLLLFFHGLTVKSTTSTIITTKIMIA